MTARTSSARRRRISLVTGIAMVAVVAAAPLTAAAQSAHSIHIAAGSLDAALQALAAQTHEQMLYASALVTGRMAPAVDGELTTEQALQRLLGDSGIAVRRTGPGVFVLRRGTPSTSPISTAPGETRSSTGAGRPFVGDRSGAAADVDAGAAQIARIPAPTPAPTVSEIQVTGTHIRGGHTASPLVVLDRDAIDRSGRATVAEALEILPQNFSGVATEGTVTTGADKVSRNTAFGSSVNLRGLGADATLVMIDGRRMAGSGSFGDFSDLSSIPTAAVSRIEILLDGASAIYGADAVGGVVNVILRKDLEGAETRLLAGTGTVGEPFQGQVSQTFGHRWSTGNVLFAYEFQQHDALNSASRRFAATADLRPLGGSDQRLITTGFPGNILTTNPATGSLVVGWAIPAGQNGVGLKPSDLRAGAINLTNQHQGEDLMPRQALHSFYLTANQAFGDRLELSGDARFGHRIFALRITPLVGAFSVTNANPFFVSPNGTTSETIGYSYNGDLPNAREHGISDSLGLSLEGRLKLFGDWRAEGYVAFAQEIEAVHTTGTINSTALSEALGTVADRPQTTFSTAVNGFFNPFVGVPGANKPAVLAYISEGFSSSRSRDQVSSANLQVDGSLFSLPAGPVKLALGGQVRRESLNSIGSNFSSTVAPTPSRTTDVSRGVVSGYAEVRAPLFGPDYHRPGFERLEVSVAGRVERYDDVGSTSNPEFGILWQPVSELTAHATYGTSFRAPALREIHDPETDVSNLFPQGALRVRSLVLSGGNPNLRPETAKSWTLGADWAPARWPGLTLGATWFDIRFRDRIDRPAFTNSIGALTDPTLSTFVTRISPATNPADLALITAMLAAPTATLAQGLFPPTAYGAIIDTRFVNTAALHVRGVDLNGAYHFDIGADRVSLAGNGSYMYRYDQQITPTAPVVNLAGVAGFPVKFRGRVTADWTHGRVTAGAAFNYVGAYHDALGVGIDAQPTVDLQVRLAPPDHGLWKGVAVTLNVRNLFDRDPPFYNNVSGFGYDAANADPIGRFASIQLTRAW
jgi:iron complex outermembrane receptor protein